MIKYIKPEINFVCFKSEDIMTLSSTPYEQTKNVNGALNVVTMADAEGTQQTNPFDSFE